MRALSRARGPPFGKTGTPSHATDNARCATSKITLSTPDDPDDKAGSQAALPAAAGSTEAVEAQLEEIADHLPPEQREMLIEVMEASSSHRGPLPTPAMLREYEAILPGLAERIVRLPEREQEHRHQTMETILRRDARLRDRGQVFGMLALVIVLAFCAYLASIGAAKIAGAVAIALVIAVVGIFVTGRYLDAHSDTNNESSDETP